MFVSYSGLHSKYPAGLDSEPELSDLMNEVATKIPGKWRDVGLQLGLDQGVLEGIALISPENTNHCYANVFIRWKNQNSTTHPYTWSTVVQALKTPAVGERRLADKIMSELSSHPFTTGGIESELSSHPFTTGGIESGLSSHPFTTAGGVKGELLTQTIYVILFSSSVITVIIMYVNELTTPQDAFKRLVLQVYLGSNTLQFSAALVKALLVGVSKAEFTAT